MEKPKLEFKEEHRAGSGLYIRVDEILFSGRSEFQDILIFRNEHWGVVFVLDGLVMMTERDEYFYHEALVHPAMMVTKHTREVLLIGGGDGGSVRELLKYSPREVVVAEIDEKVVEVSRRFLSTGRFLNDPRVKVEITDGAKKVKEKRLYDVIIVDSTDPVGPAKVLFEEEFLKDLANSLKEGGVVGMQVGSPLLYDEQIKKTYEVLKHFFRDVIFYVSFTPTYPSGMWGFLLATKNAFSWRRDPPASNRYILSRRTVSALIDLGNSMFKP
ncbi:MAG: polyamine aminopropyltransferase [Thermotogae bacterium]|nr:polyamine aminopropyltransferase [Thermotogota bacterium]